MFKSRIIARRSNLPSETHSSESSNAPKSAKISDQVGPVEISAIMRKFRPIQARSKAERGGDCYGREDIGGSGLICEKYRTDLNAQAQ